MAVIAAAQWFGNLHGRFQDASGEGLVIIHHHVGPARNLLHRLCIDSVVRPLLRRHRIESRCHGNRHLAEMMSPWRSLIAVAFATVES